jgi:DNA-binding LacI/PurR family transcriptional regulator
VLATAAELGYPGPNPLAAGLRRGRVGAIGFAYANRLSYAFEDAVTVALLAGASAAAEDAGAGLLLVPGSATEERNAAAVSAAVMDGLLVFSMADDDPLLQAAIARGLPTVVMDQPEPRSLAALTPPGAQAPRWIGIDDRAAARAAAEHVLGLGHRRIGVITFALSRGQQRGLMDGDAQGRARYAVTRRRLEGFREAAAGAGIDWSDVPVVAGVTSSVQEGAAATATLLDARPELTALLCLSDRLAEGAMSVLRLLGRGVPRDVSVVGFDDAPDAAPLGLTTVRQPHREKGVQAARMLLGLMDGRPVPATTMLEAELVMRRSSGRVAGGGS